jgi:apolipoprotein N-acyltransferase
MSVEARKKQPRVAAPGLIVWPESPAPFWTSDPRLQHWVTEMARDTNSYMIVGAVAVANSAAAPEEQSIFNSAWVVDPQGRTSGRYDKIHLVPFGEFVPLQDVLFFAKKLTREAGNFTRGTERKVFDLDGSRASVVICYESIFPNEVRQFTLNGAQVLVNISNDGWYGESSAPFQHLQMARLRAIENHRWLLVGTNSGTTAAIDPNGRIVAQVERNVRTTLSAPYAPLTDVTFYVRYGDMFAWTCVVISLLGIAVRWRVRAATMLEAPTA